MTRNEDGRRIALELVLLRVGATSGLGFEAALAQALPLLEAARGYERHQCGPCVEDPGRYVLLIWWHSLEDHAEGFRRSDEHIAWRALLDAHVEGTPCVRHFMVSPGWQPDLPPGAPVTAHAATAPPDSPAAGRPPA